MWKRNATILIISGLLVSLMFYCDTVYGKKFKMSPQNAEFLSTVRYIITKEEKKYFKHLPDEKRKEFIEQFWKVRDPDAETEENEFRETYFKRIEESNRKFSCAKEGWLTDRGKSYILLGPPRQIYPYPLGGRLSSRPYEIWDYSIFSILFVDVMQDGDYRVDYLDRIWLHREVQDAFIRAQKNLTTLDLFRYEVKYKKIKSIPYIVFFLETKTLRFKSKEKQVISTVEVEFKARDMEYNDVWNFHKTYEIKFPESQTGEQIPEMLEIRIPVEVQKGKYFFLTSIIKMDDKKKNFYNKILKIKKGGRKK
jgi:GWxTD domain-containing protein